MLLFPHLLVLLVVLLSILLPTSCLSAPGRLSRGSNFQVPLGAYLTPAANLGFLYASLVLEDPFLKATTCVAAGYTLVYDLSQRDFVRALLPTSSSSVPSSPSSTLPRPAFSLGDEGCAPPHVVECLDLIPSPITYAGPGVCATSDPAGAPAAGTLAALRGALEGTSGRVVVEDGEGGIYGVLRDGEDGCWVVEGGEVGGEVAALIRAVINNR